MSLAEKSPKLFIIKKSFLRKYGEKHRQCGSPQQPALSFPRVPSLPVLQEHRRLLFLPHEQSCFLRSHDRTTFPQLSQIQGEMRPRSVCSMEVSRITRPGVQTSFLTSSRAVLFLKCKKERREKLLFDEALMIAMLTFPLGLTSSLLDRNFLSFAVNTQSEDRTKKLC